MSTNLAKLLVESVSGSSFVAIDTLTEQKLTGGKKNPLQGHVQKETVGSNVMVFQNKNTNAYDNMVKRRLEKEGKNPESFELAPRAWGVRVPNTPFIEHKGEYYLEVIFLKAGDTAYLVDGEVTDKVEIEGLPEKKEGKQAGLEDKVIIRTFKVSSIKSITIDGVKHTDLSFDTDL